MKIAVLMGGISSEREISLKTGNAILKSLKRLGYDAFAIELTEKNMITALQNTDFDVAYIALHGEFGEDGRIQAILDILKKPYTGSSYLSSAICMDKNFTKQILNSKKILAPKTYNFIENIQKYPVVIKASRGGSSIDLYICENKEEAKIAIKNIGDKEILIEEYIKGEELTVGLIDGDPLGVLKILPKSGIYDYEAKYTKGKTIYEVPAKISENKYTEAMEKSKYIYNNLDLQGLARVDYILKKDRLYFLEVNTIPGMTETSLLPKLAELKGYSFDDLVKRSIDGLAKKAKK
ncbi:MAG: D-alanine--D-alanine ligase [Fusobacteriota bacterium]